MVKFYIFNLSPISFSKFSKDHYLILTVCVITFTSYFSFQKLKYTNLLFSSVAYQEAFPLTSYLTILLRDYLQGGRGFQQAILGADGTPGSGRRWVFNSCLICAGTVSSLTHMYSPSSSSSTEANRSLMEDISHHAIHPKPFWTIQEV